MKAPINTLVWSLATIPVHTLGRIREMIPAEYLCKALGVTAHQNILANAPMHTAPIHVAKSTANALSLARKLPPSATSSFRYLFHVGNVVNRAKRHSSTLAKRTHHYA